MSREFDSDEAMRIVKTTFDAWTVRDLEKMKVGLSEDFVQWHSHIRKDFKKDEHQALLVAILEIATFRYHNIRMQPIEGGVLVQCLCDIRGTEGDEARDVPFAMIYLVHDGLIFRCDEYMDGLSLPKMNPVPAL